MLLRHAERNTQIVGCDPWSNPITEQGMISSQKLGKEIVSSGLNIAVITSSPLLRCIQTAEGIVSGSGSEIKVESSGVLGNPGPFVMGDVDLDLFGKITVHELVRMQTSGRSIKGIRELSEGTRLMLKEMIDPKCSGNDIGIFVSHDAIIAPVLNCLTGLNFDENNWIGFLEGFCLMKEGSDWTVFNGDSEYSVTAKMDDILSR